MTAFRLDPLGLRVGHAADETLRSGATVFLPDRPAIAACHVAGGGPGTRETRLLEADATVERIDAIVLSGGSAFGLAAADGATAWLARRGRGFAVGPARVPIVPAAILFDLLNGGDKSAIPGMGAGTGDAGTGGAGPSPYFDLGIAACGNAARETPLGSVGAGTGATTADLKGGFGAAGATLDGGATIAAFAVVNGIGRATLGTGPHFRAALFEREGEFGGLGFPDAPPHDAAHTVIKRPARPGENTTLALIATDLALTKAQAKRLAVAAHDGIALAIFPAHLPLDGDIVFALSLGERPMRRPLEDLTEACATAVGCLARAIARGVHAATPHPDDPVPAWRHAYRPR